MTDLFGLVSGGEGSGVMQENGASWEKLIGESEAWESFQKEGGFR